MPACPKPAPKEKKARKPLQSKTWLSDGPRKPLKKSGETKAKKVIRQKAFYASAAWKLIRNDALDRASHRCEYVERWGFPFVEAGTKRYIRCATTKHLHVHHKSYIRFGGQEVPDDLIVYCKQHHAEIEARDHPTRKRR